MAHCKTEMETAMKNLALNAELGPVLQQDVVTKENEDDRSDDASTCSDFSNLPPEILEVIFQELPLSGKRSARQVCLYWLNAMDGSNQLLAYRIPLSQDTIKNFSEEMFPKSKASTTLLVNRFGSYEDNDDQLKTAVTDVAKIKIGGGISFINLRNILKYCQSSVKSLTLEKDCFENVTVNEMDEIIEMMNNWNILHTLRIKIELDPRREEFLLDEATRYEHFLGRVKLPFLRKLGVNLNGTRRIPYSDVQNKTNAALNKFVFENGQFVRTLAIVGDSGYYYDFNSSTIKLDGNGRSIHGFDNIQELGFHMVYTNRNFDTASMQQNTNWGLQHLLRAVKNLRDLDLSNTCYSLQAEIEHIVKANCNTLERLGLASTRHTMNWMPACPRVTDLAISVLDFDELGSIELPVQKFPALLRLKFLSIMHGDKFDQNCLRLLETVRLNFPNLVELQIPYSYAVRINHLMDLLQQVPLTKLSIGNVSWGCPITFILDIFRKRSTGTKLYWTKEKFPRPNREGQILHLLIDRSKYKLNWKK